ncbi:MAG: crotonase/enoyl-CoA hydratase family protein [Thermodesulfobacteriota bacterium]
MPVRTEKSGPVLTVILDRPEVKNAVDRVTADALADAFREFEADASASVAVLWGAGGTFCAGADLKALAEDPINRANRLSENMDEDGPMGISRMLLQKPVIAAVSGYAVAGGMELACWCDLRVVEEDAVFGVYCRRYGVPLIDGGTQRLARLIGLSRAMDMILTGRSVDAREALAFGLANYLAPPGKARETAEELAARIARFPRLCTRNDRLAAIRGFGMELKEALALEFSYGMDTLRSPEALEGAARFTKGLDREKPEKMK